MGEDLDLVDLAGVLQLDQNLLRILAEPAASRNAGEAGIDAAMTQETVSIATLRSSKDMNKSLCWFHL